MAILRFSTKHAVLGVPTGTGDYDSQPFNLVRRSGVIGEYAHPEKSSDQAPPIATGAIDRAITGLLSRSAPDLPEDQPITVMVHGFLFDVEAKADKIAAKSDNPHSRVFHFVNGNPKDERRDHTTGWPLHLGFQEDTGATGLAVAFGWLSWPGFMDSLLNDGKNFYASAYRYAEESSWPLIVLLDALDRWLGSKSTRIDLICHSLGSVLVTRALSRAAKYAMPLTGRLDRVVILGGSEYTDEARLMNERVVELAASQGWRAHQGPSFYNVASRENLVLDLLAENAGPRTLFTRSQVVGHNGLEAPKGQPRWMDFQIDSGPLADWLKTHIGAEVRGDTPTIWDHWSYYTHRGSMSLYERIIRSRRADADFQNLRALDIPEGVDIGFFGD